MLHFPEGTGPVGYQVGDYQCIAEIGRGANGQVYSAMSVKDTSKIVALKVVSKKKIQQVRQERIRKIRRKLLKSEVEIMKKFDCEHIVKCYDTYENQDYIIMALEFCDGGDLDQEITRRGRIPEEQAVRILKHIIVGFAQMHKHNIIHRDLKSQNILKHQEKYKIADFGFAKIIGDLNDVQQGTILGTLMTMAPEVMTKKKYGIKADIWSLGVVFYQMIFGTAPYRGLTVDAMCRTIRTNNLQLTGCSKQAAQLLKKMLVADPADRISWTQLYNQPLLYKYSRSTVLDEYKQDVELEVSRYTHTELEKVVTERLLLDEIRQHNDEIEDIFKEPCIKILKKSEVARATEHAHLIQNQCKLFRDYVQKLNFERQKSLLMLEEIIEVFDDERVNIQKDRNICEFLYLISSRCLYIVSPVNDALKRSVNIYDWQFYEEFRKSTLCESFIKDFRDHYECVEKRHSNISRQLFQHEVKPLQQVSDFFRKITSRQQYKAHNNFMCGIEGHDFSRAEQIKFTISNYLQPLIWRMSEIRTKTPHQKRTVERLKYHLENYYLITTAKFEEDSHAIFKIVDKWKDE